MMRGLPGSGKSTKAREMVESIPNTVRVNRDLLREMIHFFHWLPQREQGIIEMEKQIAAYYLSEEQQNVIVDDTNLGPQHEAIWRDFVNNLQRKGLTNLQFEVVDVDTPPETCVERDILRSKGVGQDVIWQMALEYNRLPEDNFYVLCDLDGTLADIEHRRRYVNDKCPDCGGNNRDGKDCPGNSDVSDGYGKHQRKDWKSFYLDMQYDTLREDVLADVQATLTKAEEEGKKAYLILLSARPANYRKQTETWLTRVGVSNYLTLIMRRAGDYREDSIVKKELLNKYFKNKGQIIKVFDDRPRVIRMWREEGLDVVDVGDGVEF